LAFWGRATTAYDGEPLLDVAFKHPIRLIANALGIAPPMMIERGRHHGVPVAALVGAKEHAIRQINAGVDVIVAQGSEAGGHYFVGQGVGLIDGVKSATRVVQDFKEDFAEAMSTVMAWSE
jgi:hypothetical protein